MKKLTILLLLAIVWIQFLGCQKEKRENQAPQKEETTLEYIERCQNYSYGCEFLNPRKE